MKIITGKAPTLRRRYETLMVGDEWLELNKNITEAIEDIRRMLNVPSGMQYISQPTYMKNTTKLLWEWWETIIPGSDDISPITIHSGQKPEVKRVNSEIIELFVRSLIFEAVDPEDKAIIGGCRYLQIPLDSTPVTLSVFEVGQSVNKVRVQYQYYETEFK